MGGAFGCAIIVIIHNDYQSRGAIVVPAIIWLSLSAGADCAIAGTLVVQLQRMKSGFKSSEGYVYIQT